MDIPGMEIPVFLNNYKVLLSNGAPIVRENLNEEISESEIDEMISRYSNNKWRAGRWDVSEKKCSDE